MIFNMQLRIKKLFVFVLFFRASIISGGRVTRMINGIVAKPEQFPFVVNLRMGKSSCSGFLITPKSVLTAAHCLRNKTITEFDVYLGRIKKHEEDDRKEKGEQHRRASKIIPHPKYEQIKVITEGSHNYDIGIVVLKEPVKITRNVKTVCLMSKKHKNPKRAIAVGYGQTEHYKSLNLGSYLRYFEVSILNSKLCTVMFRANGLAITKNQICVSHTRAGGPCYGDSGSPLVSQIKGRHVVLGVEYTGHLPQCNQPLLAIAYTRTAAYEDWIRQNVEDEHNLCFI